MNQRASILIAGGSLAGTACAIRLKQLGHDPIVLDKSHFPRAKLCGEFLGPDAFPILAKLGILETIQEHAYGPIHKTYFFNRKGQALEIQHRWINRKFPFALAIPRTVLDHLLVELTRQHQIPVLEGRRILSPVRLQSNQFEMPFEIDVEFKDAQKKNQIETYQTTFIIDATGRNGKLFLQEFNQTSLPNKDWTGIQCHVELKKSLTTKDLSMFLFPGGYGGIQPIAENKANVCMMVKSHLAKTMHTEFSNFIAQTIGKNPAAEAILSECKRDGSFSTTSDINLTNRFIANKRYPTDIIRIGDAVVTVDPFTGSGMSHALETGVMAADVIHNGFNGGLDYQAIRRQYQEGYKKRFQNRLRLMRWFRPILESERIQQGIWPVISPFLPILAHTFR